MSAHAASVGHPGRCPHWSDPAHQAAITAAYDSLCQALTGPIATLRLVGGRGATARPAHRVRELGRLARTSQQPERAALLRWNALPVAVRQVLLDSWYGRAA
ncbi:hypothetical protein SAMN03159343_3290 [Klenkia marina]|uniref:Uncharacterized protein n=1 Tax=Klenkia marina TaxID=1960309 RepID=A0A1G4YPY8_9ACTN|nr:hypothetical protein [Klenkia marina]SCX55479.1 hypothetical protein SAMN03159343_3290 [Klenkia marina]